MSNKALIERLLEQQCYYKKVQPRHHRDDIMSDLLSEAIAALEEQEDTIAGLEAAANSLHQDVMELTNEQ